MTFFFALRGRRWSICGGPILPKFNGRWDGDVSQTGPANDPRNANPITPGSVSELSMKTRHHRSNCTDASWPFRMPLSPRIHPQPPPCLASWGRPPVTFQAPPRLPGEASQAPPRLPGERFDGGTPASNFVVRWSYTSVQFCSRGTVQNEGKIAKTTINIVFLGPPKKV